jgi:uncharacterized protein (DUF362 family)/Pyruvate/2-oxoacid:ferredoxin oxidoreductase delta subunit
VRSGERILFKPNVLWGTNPAKCVVTHPAVLRAAITPFAPAGAVLQYGDSPAGILRTLPSLKKCRYEEALDGLPVTAVSFDTGEERAYPGGISSKRLQIARAVLEADGVVNLPKLKTHGLTRMTGAIKNCFGCVPGMTKGNYHTRFCDAYDFARLLADIVALVRPRLHIMDAIRAMEGNGPQSGTPKHLGVLLLSTDPVAMDTVACRIINLDPRCVPTIAAGVAAGIGTGEFDNIEIVGDDLAAVIDRTFRVTRRPPARLPAKRIVRGIRSFFLPRPVIVRKKCIRCGICASACPVSPKALVVRDKQKCPVYDYRICIRCYCCHEVCPGKAIIIKDPLVRRLFPVIPFVSLLVARLAARRKPKRN